MKKLFFVLALVAVYGVSMAANNTVFTSSLNAQTTIVAQADDNQMDTPTNEKEKAKESKAVASDSKAKAEGSADAKAKGEGCGGEAKKECGSSCGEKKK
jgi:hypothetical protein